MENIEYYNANRIIKIKVNGFCFARFWQWKSKKKILGITVREEGFYVYPGEYYGKEKPDGYAFIEGELYEKPEVVLYFDDGFKKVYLFDTVYEAKKYAEQIKNINKSITWV